MSQDHNGENDGNDENRLNLQKRIIVWRTNPQDKIRYYTHTMPFQNGVHDYLAVQTLQRCLLENDGNKKFALAQSMGQKDFNLGNFMTGTSSHKEAIQLHHELVGMIKPYGLTLQNWCSNEERIFKQIPVANRQSKLTIDIRKTKCNALIFSWNSIKDTFEIDYIIKEKQDINEDVIRQEAESLFDPLGLISPVLMYAKHVVNKLNSLPSGWVLDKHKIVQNWLKFRDQLKHLNNIKFSVPRRIFHCNSLRNQLHIFIFVSTKIYGVAIYAKSITSLNETLVNLVYSKSSEPQHNLSTIQEMETKAAAVAFECNEKITSAMDLQNDEVWYWASSRMEIPNLNYIDIKLNPANLIGEEMSLSMLLDSDLWWHGPPFLKKNQSKWPSSYNEHLEQLKTTQKAESIMVSNNHAIEQVDATSSRSFYEKQPFDTVEISFIGPVNLQYTSRKTKSNGFVCVLTCTNTKAIHLEPIVGKYIDNITDCLHQSFAKSGQPSTLFYIDRNMNNMGKSKLTSYLNRFMRNYNQKTFKKFCQTLKIEWKIISGSNTQQLWELAIESAKEQVSNILTTNIIEICEFHELLSNLEAIINSRPIESKSNDPNDVEFESAAGLQVPHTSSTRNIHHQLTRNKFQSWLRIRTITSEFWRNWIIAYYNNFQFTQSDKIKIGQLVTIKYNNPPPSHWKTGRILNIEHDPLKRKKEVIVKTKLGVEAKYLHEICMIPTNDVVNINRQKLEHQAVGQIRQNSTEKMNNSIIMRIKKEREPNIYSSMHVKSDRVKRYKAQSRFGSSYSTSIAILICLIVLITGVLGNLQSERIDKFNDLISNNTLGAKTFSENFSTTWKNGGWVPFDAKNTGGNIVSGWINYIAWTTLFLILVIMKSHSVSARALPQQTHKCQICLTAKPSYIRILDCYCVMCEPCAAFAAFTMEMCPVCCDHEVTGIDVTPVDVNGRPII